MSSRTGGNGIPHVVRAVDGLELAWCAIQLALRESPDPESRVREVWLSRSVGGRVEDAEREDPYRDLVLGLHEADQEPSVADLDGRLRTDVEVSSTVGEVAP